MSAVPEFPAYDPGFAAAAKGHRDTTGLPGFLGVEMSDVGPGRMRFSLEVRPELMNPFGVLHGGVISALADHALGAVCYPVIPQGTWAATTEYKLNLLAPVREGTVEAEAEIVSMTMRMAVVRIDIRNGDRLVALVQGTVVLKPPKG